MASLTFINESNGKETEVAIEDGETIMSLAVDNLIDGIEAECGGAMSCGTCHCYVDEKFLDRFPEKDDMEDEMLEIAAEKRANSRLSCRLEVDGSMDGLRIFVPKG